MSQFISSILFKTVLLVLPASLFLYSCNSSDQSPPATPTVNEIVQTHDTIPEVAPWADTLINDYLNFHQQDLRGSEEGPLTYIKEYGDWEGKKYLTVRIGNSFPDHYATLKWLFIDSTSRKVFELDIPNDTLIEWVVE